MSTVYDGSRSYRPRRRISSTQIGAKCSITIERAGAAAPLEAACRQHCHSCRRRRQRVEPAPAQLEFSRRGDSLLEGWTSAALRRFHLESRRDRGERFVRPDSSHELDGERQTITIEAPR
jgi:hypothetical protein